jgi:hypothetical protein
MAQIFFYYSNSRGASVDQRGTDFNDSAGLGRAGQVKAD